MAGDRDYYPTLNALDGAILLAARGDRAELDALAPERADWLGVAIRNGQRRYAEERDFFNAYAEVDAARVDALWAMLDGRDDKALSKAEVRNALVTQHRDLFKSLGNDRVHESAMKQLQWLLDLLPDGPMRQALRQLQTAIEAA
jgi:hypothetical protein